MTNKIIFLTFLIWFLPHFLFVSLNLSSPAFGIFIVSIIIFLFDYKIFFYKKFMSLSFLVILSFLLTILVVKGAFVYAFDFIPKPFFSSFLLILMILSAYIFSLELKKITFSDIKKIIEFNLILLLILGYAKLVYIPTCCGYDLFLKPVFPFSEESHFALTVVIFLLPYAILGNILRSIIFILMFFILSLMYPSLTLLLASIFSLFFMSLRMKHLIFRLAIFVFPLFIIFITNFFILKLDYFSSRLIIKDTKNLTTLVFLQGIELAYLNLIKTFGIGIGFQMLGTKYTYTGKYTALINSIFRDNLNLSDGGFFASKIIAEFGVLGLVISILYFIYIISFIFNTNKDINLLKKAKKYHWVDKNKTLFDEYQKYLLIKSFIIGFIVEFFFRGYGYFSTSLFFVIVSLIYVLKNKPKFLKLSGKFYVIETAMVKYL